MAHGEVGNASYADTRLILVGGFSGSGKSEFGQSLATILTAAYLDKDTLTRPFVEETLRHLGGDPNDRDSDTYRSKVRPLEYEVLMDAAHENIRCGSTTVVSAPLLLEVVDDVWLDDRRLEAEGEGATTSLVWVATTIDDMRRNMTRRNAARDRWKLSHWQEYIDSIDVDMRPVHEHTLVWNNGELSSLFNQASAVAVDGAQQSS